MDTYPDLYAEHITKSFSSGLFRKKKGKKKVVLKDISFQANAGECIGILGANGCGKSTLLSILSGVLPPDQGTLLYKNQKLFTKDKKLITHVIGYVPQEPPLIPELNALDNLKLWYCDSPLSLEKELENGFLSILGISDFLKTPVYKMSGGMKKRLAIGCCIANTPKVLLLDEPGAALDIPCREQIEHYLKSLKQQGNIIILTTHEEREIRLCDKLYILKNGVLCPYDFDGDIHQVADKL